MYKRIVGLLCMLFLAFYPLTLASAEGLLYKEQRSPETQDSNEWTTIKASEGGIRIVSRDGNEMFLMDNYGGLYIYGDLFLNNKKVNDAVDKVVTYNFMQLWLIIIIVLLALTVICMIIIYLKLNQKIDSLTARVKFELESKCRSD